MWTFRLFAILLASSALAQVPASAPERALRFSHPLTASDYQEIATILRTVLDISTVKIDQAQQLIAVNGTTAQMADAEWLVTALDMPDEAARKLPVHERTIEGKKPEFVRVFYLDREVSNMDVQELLTVLRTVADVQKIFNYSSNKALAVRADAPTMDMTVWLVTELNRTRSNDAVYSGIHEHRILSKSGDLLRVFFPEHARSSMELSALVTALRRDLRVEKAFHDTRAGAVVMRGSPELVSQSERLITARDQIAAR